MPKISVIIPVYNVGKVLPRCLDSLIGQTFRDWEAICVDDIFDWATEYSHPDGREMKRWAVKHCQPWRCLYRTDRIRHIGFIPGIIYEDFPWWSEVLLNVRRITIINLPLYYYYIHSATRKFRIESLKVAVAAAEKLYETGVEASSKAKWEKNFLVPFKDKLRRKEKNA